MTCLRDTYDESGIGNRELYQLVMLPMIVSRPNNCYIILARARVCLSVCRWRACVRCCRTLTTSTDWLGSSGHCPPARTCTTARVCSRPRRSSRSIEHTSKSSTDCSNHTPSHPTTTPNYRRSGSRRVYTTLAPNALPYNNVFFLYFSKTPF